VNATTTMPTPIGPLRLTATPRGLARVEFLARSTDRRGTRGTAQARAHLGRAVRQLREYFAGRRKAFNLALDLQGDAHQLRVWQELLAIPFGQTASYGQVAKRVGSPLGARAVGRACATNPLPVVVPCHRVVGSDGSLHGFGGGLWRKRALLEHEGHGLPFPR